MNQNKTAAQAGRFSIGGDLTVNRLGFGSMRLTGENAWGEPKNPNEAVKVLQRVVEMGVNFIDTADAYGPFVSDKLIKQALYPYRDDLIIATKVGLTRTNGLHDFTPVGRPEYLRQQVELSLLHLGLERIDLLQLHRIDPKIPLEEQVGELFRLQQEGKVRHIGLSEVSVEQLQAATKIAPIASVQNWYNLTRRDAEDVLVYAEARNIAFIPFFPLATGDLTKEGSQLDEMAKRYQVKPAQLALMWLLKRSSVMLPIPGTSKIAHAEENIAAASIELSDQDFEILSTLA